MFNSAGEDMNRLGSFGWPLEVSRTERLKK